MVAIEVRAHGLPTVAFTTGGLVDAVGNGTPGHLVSADDYAAFAQAMLRVLSTGPGASRDDAVAFASGFGWPRFGERMWTAIGLGTGNGESTDGDVLLLAALVDSPACVDAASTLAERNGRFCTLSNALAGRIGTRSTKPLAGLIGDACHVHVLAAHDMPTPDG